MRVVSDIKFIIMEVLKIFDFELEDKVNANLTDMSLI